MVATQGKRGVQALVGVGRRHAHVGDHDVGAVVGDGGGKRRGITDSGDHLVAKAGDQRHEPLAQQHRVVGEDYPGAWQVQSQ